MTRIDFAFGAPDRLRTACQVARKRYLAGQRLVVYCRDGSRLASFDRMLWAFDDISFVPHVLANDPLAADTPVVLTASDPLKASEKLVQAGSRNPGCSTWMTSARPVSRVSNASWKSSPTSPTTSRPRASAGASTRTRATPRTATISAASQTPEPPLAAGRAFSPSGVPMPLIPTTPASLPSPSGSNRRMTTRRRPWRRHGSPPRLSATTTPFPC